MAKVIRLTENDLVRLVNRVIEEQFSDKQKKQMDVCFKKNSPYFSKIASSTGANWNEPYGEGSFLGYKLHADRDFNIKGQDKSRLSLDVDTDGCTQVTAVIEFSRMGYGGKYAITDFIKRLQDTIKSSGLTMKCTDHDGKGLDCKQYSYVGKPGDPNVFKVIDIYKKFIL